MVRGKSFYAVWDQEQGLWSTDEYDVQRLVDRDLEEYAKKLREKTSDTITVKWMADFSSNSWCNFKNYLSKVSDNGVQLDNKLTFQNDEIQRSDYVSKRLPYPLEEGPYDAYDELIGTLYDPEERQKLEWAIGAVITGDAKTIQKFIVLYGEAGAGKSTILNIIQKLFHGYYTTFEAKALVSSNNAFSTEVFKSNPLVAIQHDGDLSKIEDNTKLNSIVSHEEMTMNEKYKASYMARVNCFLFMATNRPVKITDAKSGVIRRLIDVKPSGRKIKPRRYHELMQKIDFELSGIASHCRDVYLDLGKNYYNSYVPFDMIFQTDVFFNFVEDQYDLFCRQDGISLKQAYTIYKQYCDDALVQFKSPMYRFREELKNYFKNFEEVARIDGKQIRSYYSGFLKEKFSITDLSKQKEDENNDSSDLILDRTDSLFDLYCADCPAQYANADGTPIAYWSDVTTTLKDIDTSKLHYVKVPLNHIVIDFDLKDESGEKSAKLNLEAAAAWPPTYAEFSKGGSGVHLHYLYAGDPERLSRLYSENIEVKVFVGNSSLRRRLSYCNDIPIATINSGLPVKGEKVINFETLKNEKALRTLILNNLAKQYHPATKPSVEFIDKILKEAEASGLSYDITDMRPKILAFANNSTNHADYCVRLVTNMKFKSDVESEVVPDEVYELDDKLVFFDCEVFPNLFLINWKYEGSKTCVRMINPTPDEVSEILRYKLVGFNCRRYDNHILYARTLGYSNAELYQLSKRIVDKSANCFFREAYNLSYTDVYDFVSKKQGLKKYEIELGIHHKELGLPWDEPVPEDKWQLVAEYCDNDVIATEAVFNARKADFLARQILADLAGSNVNNTTNNLTAKIIFGGDRNPQSQFNYRNLAEPVKSISNDMRRFLEEACPEMMAFPHGPDKSILPYFPGYKFEKGVSTYRSEVVSEGGKVYSEPSMYTDVALLDITSMHPHSTIAEMLFGLKYTTAYREIVEGRVDIKHEAWDAVNKIMGGKLTPYIQRVIRGELTAKDLANALKIAINSVYGLTSAHFENPFKDNRNIDNIVAKRGALFMIDLKHKVQEEGYQVAHIKTDSIKIPNADPYIIKVVMDFGKRYGYNFEHEATYDRMCLVNDAVYIAKFATPEKCQQLYGYVPDDNAKHGGEWTPTGTQFQVPFVFKTLFSHEPIEFADLCETKEVKTSIYLDMNENLPDVSYEEKALSKVKKKFPDDWKTVGKDLIDKIDTGHAYVFVGKVGSFCPIKPGNHGGVLLRASDNGYSAVTGTIGYRWLEAEQVKTMGLEDCVDMRYYQGLVDAAVETISKYCDFEWFVSEDKSSDETPPWKNPCGDEKYKTCADCPCFDKNKSTCNKGYKTYNFVKDAVNQ